jgi:hypothetical protein
VALLRLSAPLARIGDLAGVVGEEAERVALDCRDADTVIVAGALHGEWTKPIGVWLEISADYPAQLAARDVATLSWLIELDLVVVSCATAAEDHADVMRALLTDDEVTFSNDVATLTRAYNRPAPPRPLTVWSFDGAALSHGPETLRPVATSSTTVGELTRFEPSYSG